MLAITRLRKVFNPDGVNAVIGIDRIDCSVSEGQFVTIIGSNGAGKSTFLNLIAGTCRPDEGRIRLDGTCIDKWPEHRRAALIGRVFQNPLLGSCASMSIEENLALAARRGRTPGLGPGVTNRDRVLFREKLHILGLGLENRLKDKVGLLSGGQRQALTLLMATIKRPRLLLLDEHSAALDPHTAESVLTLTRNLVGGMNLTTLLVTHNMALAIELGNRLLMMHQGRIILDVPDEAKRQLKVRDLLGEFAKLRGRELTDDTILLA